MSETPLWDPWRAGREKTKFWAEARKTNPDEEQIRRKIRSRERDLKMRERELAERLSKPADTPKRIEWIAELRAEIPVILSEIAELQAQLGGKPNPDVDLRLLLRVVQADPNDMAGWRSLLTQAWRSGMTVTGRLVEPRGIGSQSRLSAGAEVQVDFPIQSGRNVGLSVSEWGSLTSQVMYAKNLTGLQVEPQRPGHTAGPRSNPDESERILERAAKLGDVRAQRKLDQARARRGVKKTLTWGVVPEYGEFLEHTSAMGVEWPITYGLNDVDAEILYEAVGGASGFRRLVPYGSTLVARDAAEAHEVLLGLSVMLDELRDLNKQAADMADEFDPGMGQAIADQAARETRVRSESAEAMAGLIIHETGYEWV